jgi:hypothetical protein
MRIAACLFIGLLTASLAAGVINAPIAFEGWRTSDYGSYTTALATGNGWVFDGFYYNYFVGLNGTNGSQVWLANTTNTVKSLVYDNEQVLFLTSNEVGAVNAWTGKDVWRLNSTSSYSFSYWLRPDNATVLVFSSYYMWTISIAVNGSISVSNVTWSNYIYAAPVLAPWANWTVLIPTTSYLICVNSSGYVFFNTYVSYYFAASPVVWNNTIYALSTGGNIYKYNQTGTLITSGSLTYSPSTIYGFRAYVNSSGAANLVVVGSSSWIQNFDPVLMILNNKIQTSTTVFSTAYDWMNQTYYITDTNGNFYRLDLDGFSWKWNTPSAFTYVSSSTAGSLYQNGTYYTTIYAYNSGDGSSYYTYYLIGLNAWTGKFTVQARSDYVFAPMVFDAVSFGGAIVGGSYRLTSVLVNAAVTSSNSSVGTVSFPSTIIANLGTWNNVMYFGQGQYISAVAINGTSLWNTSITNYPAQAIYPAFANGNVYFVDNLDKILVLSASNGTLIATVSSVPTKGDTTCPTSGYSLTITGLVADGTDVFFTARTQCVYRLDKTNVLWGVKATTSLLTPIFLTPPTTSSQFVYAVDYYGYTFGFLKLTMSKVWTSSKSISATTTNGAPMYIEGDLYVGGVSNLYAIGSTAGTSLWTAYTGSATYPLPYSFYGYVYATTNNGNVTCFEEGYWLSSANGYKLVFAQLTSGSSTLGVPAISPDGIMVFASSTGVFAVRYNGTSVWNNTQETICSNPSVYQGVAYAFCSGQLILYDLYKGSIWLRSPKFNSYYNVQVVYANNSAYIASGSTLYGISTGTNQLYAPSQLPAPLPPRKLSLLEQLEKNKLWIAGVVAGIVVIVIVVLVAKKLSGGAKKDTDYVAMQNPVNTGGV